MCLITQFYGMEMMRGRDDKHQFKVEPTCQQTGSNHHCRFFVSAYLTLDMHSLIKLNFLVFDFSTTAKKALWSYLFAVRCNNTNVSWRQRCWSIQQLLCVAHHLIITIGNEGRFEENQTSKNLHVGKSRLRNSHELPPLGWTMRGCYLHACLLPTHK